MKSPVLSVRVLLPGVVAAIAVVLLSVMQWVNLQTARQQAVAQVIAEVRASGSELQRDLDRAHRRGDRAGLVGSVMWTGTHQLAAGAAVVGADGLVIAANRMEWIGQPVGEVLPWASLHSTDANPSRVEQAGATDLIVGYFPVDLDVQGAAGTRGILVYALDASRPVAEARYGSWGRFRTLALGTLVLVMVLGLALNRLISRRVSSLSDTIAKIAAGDLKARPNVSGTDELGQLASGLTNMTERLTAAFDERDRATYLLQLQNQVLASIADDQSLVTVLDLLCLQVQSLHPQSVCSVMELNRDGMMRVIAGPSLGTEARAMVDGLIPGPAAASCGTAVFTRQPVYASDTSTDPRWAGAQPIVKALGVRSCWSVPITDGDLVFGSFAISHTICRQPSSQDRELLDAGARLAGIAVRRARTQLELRKSEERFRATFEQAAIGIAHIAPDGRFLRMNARFGSMLGYSAEELLSLRFQQVTHADDVDIDVKLGEQVLAGVIPTYQNEKRYVRRDGSLIWVNLTVSLHRSESGEPEYLISVVQDITDRKLAEAEAQRTSALLQAVSDGAPDAIFVKDREGKYLLFNEAATRFVGKPVSEVLGRDDTELFDQASAEIIISRDRRVMDTNEAEIEEETLTARGITRTYLARKAPYRDPNGQVIGVIGVSTDITERKWAEEALRDSEERFRLYADHSADALFVHGPDGRVLDVNTQACVSLGYDREELIGMMPSQFDSELTEEFSNQMSRQLQVGQTVVFDSSHRRKDGTVFPVEVRIRPFDTVEGRFGLSAVRDITERKRAEAALRESEERFRTFLDNAPVLAWVNDEKGANYFSNAAFTQTYGLNSKQMKGRSIRETLGEEHPVQDYIASDHMVLSTNAPVQVEETGPSVGGGEGRYIVTKFPLGTGADGRRLIGGVAIEITERVRAEAAVRASERRLALAVGATSDAVWEWNYRTGETYYSPRWYQMVGADPSMPMTFDTWKSLCHPDDVDATLAKVQTAIDHPGVAYESEFRVRRNDGSVLWVLGRGNVVERDAEGNPLLLAGTNSDITDRKRAADFASRQTTLLELIARRHPLTDVLTGVVKMVEDELAGTIASVLMLDRDNRHLRFGAGPSLPAAYNEAIDGVEIGPDVGSCGTAAYLQKQVRVNDIATDPLWAKFKDLALAHGLHACWSEPILSASRGEGPAAVLGTFGVYRRTPGEFESRYTEVIERAELLASIAIESDRAARDLRDSEQQFRTVFESVPVGLIAVDINGQVVMLNRRCLDDFGYSREELLGQSVECLVPESLRARHSELRSIYSAQPVSRAMGEGKDLFGQRKDGTYFPVEVGLVPMTIGHDRLMLAAVTDISMRVEADRRTGESEARKAAILDSALDCIISIDHDGRVIDFNPAAEQTFKYPASEVLGQPLPERFLPFSIREKYREGMAQYLKTGEGLALNKHIEFPAMRADGTEFPAELSITTIKSGDRHTFTAHLRDITERKRAEDELRVRTALLEALVDSAPDGILVVDNNGRKILHNRQLVELWKIPPEIVNDIDDATQVRYVTNYTKDPAAFVAKVKELYADPLLVSRDKLVLIDGTVLDRYSGPVLDTHGKCYGRIWTFRDVTEPNRVEERLQKMSFCVDNAGYSVFWIDEKGQIFYANEAACKDRGYTREEMLTMKIFQLDPDYQEGIWGNHFSDLRRRGTVSLETRHQCKDGRIFPIEVSANYVKIGGEEFNFAFARDITERKHAEDEIRALNADLERRVAERTEELTRIVAILEASPDFIATSDDPKKHLTYANGAMRRLAAARGLAPDELRLPVFHPPETFRYINEFAVPMAIRDGIWIGETTVIGVGGGVVPVSQLIQTHKSPDGRIQYLSTIMRDISELKQLESELRQGQDSLLRANAELSKASRLKDEFLASMSHELRTPLNGVLALSESLLEGVYGPINPQQAAALRDIEQSGRHLLALINDILDLSKIEAGQITLEHTSVDVDALCQAALRLVKEMAQQKRHRITTSVDGSIGIIHADAKRLKQVLVNLLSNAVKFTPDGGSVGLEVTGDRDANVVRFSVTDTGIGIQESDLGLLFRPFQQIDSRLSREYSGTGLGLALVRRMVELHGGGVEVESHPGVGSRFTITIPWQAPKQIDAMDDNPPGRIRKVVVVEDSPGEWMKLERYLGDLNVQTVIQPGAKGAVERIREEQPDLVLLDLLLPDGDGLQVLEGIKNDTLTGSIPVVVISVVDERQRCLAHGAAEVLLKPIDRETLRATLQQVVTPLDGRRIVAVLPPAPGPSAPLILLAEDNPLNARTISDYLQATGYRVVVADTGVSAVDLAKKHQPALILMDIQMPRMDGLEATRRLRADDATRNIPVIAVTALAMPGDRERCLAAGADEYLTKPVHLRQLREIVGRLLGRTS